MTNYKIHKVDNHTITEQSGGLYTVRNNKSGDVYQVDVFMPYCSCNGFKYSSKEDKEAGKGKHIKMCRGIRKSKE